MKKTSIVGIAARFAAGIALVSSTALTAQAAAFGTIAGDKEPNGIDDMFLKMRKQFEHINYDARELTGMINDQMLADPVTVDGFDFQTIGEQLFKSGMIADMAIWNDAATTMKSKKGFMAYIDQVQTRLSTLDQMLATIGSKIAHWATLSEDDRMAAVMNNTDDNIMPALAQLHAAVTMFGNYTMVGVIVFAQMSYDSTDTGALAPTDSVAAKQLEAADA